MQTTAIRTVTNSLPENEAILLTLLISKRYIPYTDLGKFFDNGAMSRWKMSLASQPRLCSFMGICLTAWSYAAFPESLYAC